MMRPLALALPLLALALPVGAETVYQPGHRTWTNSWVPPHYETKPDTRYIAPRNQPLESLVEPQKKPSASPPISVYTPAPQYDPYYNALNAASRPMNFPKPRAPAGANPSSPIDRR
jgi:hypothetical protein